MNQLYIVSVSLTPDISTIFSAFYKDSEEVIRINSAKFPNLMSIHAMGTGIYDKFPASLKRQTI
jgi:hypothetical protein